MTSARPLTLRGARHFQLAAFLGLMLTLPTACAAQDKLKAMPGYERLQKMSKEIDSAVTLGALSVTWKDGGRAFEYQKDRKSYRYEIDARQLVELPKATGGKPGPAATQRRRGSGQRAARPARGRQSASTLSPDGNLEAYHRDRNVWVSQVGGSNELAVTTDGSDNTRIKYGTATWVYGEELNQNTAMWWSTNSQKLAFYRFDESRVLDYYLTLKEAEVQNSLYVEPYSKAGAPNPEVDLLIYDVKSKRTVRVDVRSGKTFEDGVPGHYVWFEPE